MGTTEVTCEHCQEPIKGQAYRVTSEEGATVILDMIVCQACCWEARKLGLKTEELDAAMPNFRRH